MRKFIVQLAVVLAICAPRHAGAQSVSGRTLLTGFELGTLGEGIPYGAGGSVQSAIHRSGSFAYRANPLNSNAYIAFESRSAGGIMRPIFRSSRFYLYVNQLPLTGSVSIVKIGGAQTYNPEVDLNSDGTLTLADSWYASLSRSQKALSADGLWHRIEFNVGTGLSVYVDGTLWASGGSTNYPAGIAIAFGAGSTPTFINASADLYFDDVMVDGGSFSVTGFPGDGHVTLVSDQGDPAALNSWTGGAGGTTNLRTAISTTPPAGHPATSETNQSQIKNAGRTGNLNYSPSLESYASAGVPLNATINAVMPICSDSQESGKGTKSGAIWIASNPSQSQAYTFDFGDGSSVAGMFPAGWTTHFGLVVVEPSLNIGTSPTVSVQKTTKTADVVDVDFLGLYVDWR